MSRKQLVLLVALVATIGCDAARFPNRFLSRTHNRQNVPGDAESGTGALNETIVSVTSNPVPVGGSATGGPVTAAPATDASVTDSYYSDQASSVQANTASSMMATGSTGSTMMGTGSTGSTMMATGSTGSATGSTMMATGSTGSHTGSTTPSTGTTPSTNNQSQRPNIVVFIADDLGRSDLSYTEGNIWTPTPNIDKLAWDGIILNHFYAQQVCTPSRSAFMTGKYIFNIGMQSNAISSGEPWGVPLEFKFQPEYFQKLGYQTYHVGKWHLGEFTRQYYPQSRGFDYSYGFTGGATNWWNYTEGWIVPVPLSGREIRENGLRILANDTNNFYFPDLINTKAEQLIRNQDPTKPFYLYFATPIVHTASNGYGDSIDSVPRYQLRPSVLSFTEAFPERKRQLSLVQALDDSFLRITEALVNKGVANNTIVVFFADNGAPIPESGTFVRGSNHGVNWPLRQGKGTLFEGGVRVPAFIWSPLLKKRGRITDQLFHVSDWFPTLYEAAGGNINDLTNLKLDGVSQWKSLQSGLNYGPRKEVAINIDQLSGSHAFIHEDQYGGLYKLIGGNVFDNSFLGWFPPEGTNALNLNEVPDWKTWTPTTINCNFPAGQEVSPCVPNVADCLFDLTNDPCETNNIAASYPAMLQLIQAKIRALNATAYPAAIKPYDPASRPELWEGWWVPWKDPQPWDEGAHTNPLIPVESF